MPIYLVRWQNLSAAFVSARDEEDLLDRLDELADTEGATWSVYRGPLWIEFDVPIEFEMKRRPEGQPPTLQDITITDISKFEPPGLEVSVAGTDTGSEMLLEVYRRAFPHLHKLFEESGLDEDPDSEGAVKTAALEDLKPLVEASWRIANRGRRTDEIGRLATFMRAPVRWVEASLRRAGQLAPEPPAAKKKGTVHRVPPAAGGGPRPGGGGATKKPRRR